MTYEIINKINSSLDDSPSNDRSLLLEQLRTKSRDETFLKNFPSEQLDQLIIVYSKMSTLKDQLVIISTICNVLLLNDQFRNEEASKILQKSVPRLEDILDYVSEREINSESQYNDFLPIFRLYYLLSYNSSLIPLIKSAILKISGKLLNFITLSGVETKSLNKIIIEILKIIYSFVHQGEDSSGIDSVFVLSCNKFNLLYNKSIQTSQDYDEILQHFGNILITISIEVAKNYMLNKKTFAQNEIKFLNKISFGDVFGLNTPVSNLLTLDVLITMDHDENEVKNIVKNELNLDHLETLGSKDLNLSTILIELKKKLEIESSFDFTKIQESSFINNPGLSNSSNSSSNNKNDNFDELSNEEQEEELNKIADIFEKIEKNGILKIQTT
ncbi:hypothetical protein BN7_1775 [Wickerhamomyces ciferrii]|uniref:Uncharacterized protein n=1 Tax=Wickerhamomyces ciferrii (strain ATCC 14091 / BCRC 22168 / CBS 111 / JCM 3599 / NBRC 0793 / NRRL Y-1031 F-60-10) TaxID=1206466 RepID=K0KGX7_WICCF|nr:uncharacterized protein BN7_1775 [Wickerhamomyces ciferrii]CCH42231.1 hypothetical protein BN7_1775 [Wickerhamomyces ciferrii]